MMQQPLNKLGESIGRAPQWVTVVFAALVTFSVYTCMYGYRKAFTAAGFEHQSLWGIDYKVWLVTAQVIGYMLSKFYGIKFIAENINRNRNVIILRLITVAWLALLGFALVPAPWNILFLFINGFPLGMIWGLVFSYVEGRKTTELMGAVLASSFIFASGFAKSMGTWLMNDMGVSDRWMPFTAGAVYFIPLIIFTTLLKAIPPPTEEDQQNRCVRTAMDGEQRKQFIQTFFPGLLLLIISYILLTILRDFRDNFAPEILNELGLGGKAALFTQTETPVALMVLAVVSLLMLVKDNFRAFILNHYIILAGWGLAAIATLLFRAEMISPVAWFTCVGTGLYLGYIPINCLYFDRMIASFRLTANVGFVMYVADSFGYLGSVLVLFIKQFSGLQLSWTNFFSACILGGAGVSIFLLLAAIVFYRKKYKQTINELAL
jgi:MFS family permease